MKTTKRIHHPFRIVHSAFCIAALTSLMTAAHAADVSDVIVRQQWPWSTDIKVEYKLTNMTGPVTVNVEAFDGNTPLDSSNLKAAIVGDLWGVSESGAHSFIIKPAVAFGAARDSIGDFKVRLSLTDEPTANDILYKIVDLDPPYNSVDVRRKDFYNGKYGEFVTSYQDIDSTFSTSLDDVLIWLDVTNDVYKTDKMVFRRIPAAGQSYMMQQGVSAVNDGAGVEVSFTNDFYIGVYEVTQTQMNKFYRYFGANSDYSAFPNAPGSGHDGCNSYETNALYRAKRPATGMQFNNSNGTVLRRQDQSLTDHTKVGPASAGTARGTLCYNMQDKTGLLVDLPTEAMWEYACRAGTTTALYSGKAYSEAEARKLSTMNRYSGTNKRNADLTRMSNIVGSYKPNAWGLYDMIGNAREWCLDKWQDAGSLTGGENPVSTTYASGKDGYHVQRGAGITTANASHLVTYRIARHKDWSGLSTSGDGEAHGVRLCIYCDLHDDGTL